MRESVMRRTLLGAGALLAAPAIAQPAWPNRPLRFIVGFAAGGPTDTLARLAAPGFQEALGQPVVVENRPGAAANLGTEAVIRATDGHTFLIANSGQVVINPHTYANLPFDPMRDLAPVAKMMTNYFLMTIAAQVPAQNHAELVALMRRSPGFTYASTGAGGITHVVTEAWRRAVGVEAEPVHFRGTAAAIPDVLANRVPIFMDGIQLLGQHVDSGRLRALFVTRAERQALQPNVPTTREIGIPAVDFESWFAMFAPRNTPREIILRMAEINRPVMLAAAVRERLAQGAVDSVPSTPEELATITARDFELFGRVVRAGNIRAE
ncbi:MAG: tripartite tricarboxylate transporter substrate binding protein [Roseococcus sp.]|nr:tripartite tricarboxylate transporter substrate binding protein [Roseococcus sp.]